MEKLVYNTFLIKYGEIYLKGKNRYIFIDKLILNIKNKINLLNIKYNVIKKQGRIYVELENSDDFTPVLNKLKEVFGIVTICPVIVLENKDYDNLTANITKIIKKYTLDKPFTFKFECRREDKSYIYNSMQLNAKLGETILNNINGSKVDVKNPDILINVEIREKAYIYFEQIKGIGGMPIGTSGKAMLLLSGGIDSPVSGYLIGKRGVTIDAIYFHAPPYTSIRAKNKVIDLAKIVSKYTGNIKLHIINFTDIQLNIYDKCPHEELTIIMRRYMMRIAEEFAIKNDCLGLITGESIGQVASQTMKSLLTTNEVCSIPVYRPLIGMDKQEIIEVSKKIGTFETSILPFEDCCTIFVAKHPVTQPNLNIIKKNEKKLEDTIDELLSKAITSCEIIEINEYEE